MKILASQLKIGDFVTDPLCGESFTVKEIDEVFETMIFVNPGSDMVVFAKNEQVEIGGAL